MKISLRKPELGPKIRTDVHRQDALGKPKPLGEPGKTSVVPLGIFDVHDCLYEIRVDASSPSFDLD